MLANGVDETCKLKIFVFDKEVFPYMQAEEIKDKYKQIAILKFDDMGAGNISKFEKTKTVLDSFGVKAGFGAMGKNFESASDEVWNTLLSWQNDGIEIWHHGYASTADEYNVSGGGGNTTQETMLENFSKTYDLFDNHGIKITTFGSPHNNADAICVKMLDENYAGKIKTLLLVSNAVGDENFTVITKRIDLETPTLVINYESFKSLLDADNGASKVFVMQSHPSQWIDTESGKTQLEESIRYAQSKDVMFMTPLQYYNYELSLK